MGKRATERWFDDVRGMNKSVGVPFHSHDRGKQIRQRKKDVGIALVMFQGTTQYRCANCIVRVPVKTPSLVAVKAGIGALNWGSGIF